MKKRVLRAMGLNHIGINPKQTLLKHIPETKILDIYLPKRQLDLSRGQYITKYLPSNTDTIRYIPSNSSGTGFLNHQYSDDALTPYLPKDNFDKIVTGASTICSKAYS